MWDAIDKSGRMCILKATAFMKVDMAIIDDRKSMSCTASDDEFEGSECYNDDEIGG